MVKFSCCLQNVGNSNGLQSGYRPDATRIDFCGGRVLSDGWKYAIDLELNMGVVLVKSNVQFFNPPTPGGFRIQSAIDQCANKLGDLRYHVWL